MTDMFGAALLRDYLVTTKPKEFGKLTKRTEILTGTTVEIILVKSEQSLEENGIIV
jgi:hypothetical protein